MKKASKAIIGIDLGTTNSAVAVLDGGVPKIIANPEGDRTTPSVVSFKNGKHEVGDVAKRQMITNPNTITSIKRHMGDKNYRVKVGNKSYTPQQISAMILGYIKDFAQNYIGAPVNKAIITVPAYFDNDQRQATKDAGTIAGLKVERIINEPTAASLAYGLSKKQDQKVVVFDLGGGTFDVSVLQLGEGIYQVLSTNGDTHLGGDDFDHRIMQWLINGFKNQYGLDLSKNRMAVQRIRDAAERAKIKLSTAKSTNIILPFIAAGKHGPLHLKATLTRDMFNKLTIDLVRKTRIPFDKALSDAGLTTKDIDHVILNGGSTRIPSVQEAVREMSGQEPDHSINPDEAVADGAAIQGGVLNGSVKNVVLLDVTPLSLGIRTAGGKFEPLIKRNTTIPTSHTEAYSTAVDNETVVTINVYQGDRPLVKNDKLLATLKLTGIPEAPKGVPNILVTFDIDKNGIVNVTAEDQDTGKSQHIVIKNANGLSRDEIKKMEAEAKVNQKTDQKALAIVNTKNALQHLILEADETRYKIKGIKDISKHAVARMNFDEDRAKKVVKSNNLDSLRIKKNSLTKAVRHVSIQLYKSKAKAAKIKKKNKEKSKKNLL